MNHNDIVQTMKTMRAMTTAKCEMKVKTTSQIVNDCNDEKGQ